MLQRRSSLKRSGKLNAVRKVPRTNRMKANARFPSKHEERYWSTLEKRCVACGATEDTVIHHILARIPQKTRQRDHKYVCRLCPDCHNMGDHSVHLLGSEERFQHRRGVDLVKIAVDNWERFDG